MLHDLRVTVCVCSEGSALLHINIIKTAKNKTEKHRRHWLPWLSTIVATMGVRLAMPVRMSLVPTKVRTIVRIEVGNCLGQSKSGTECY